MQNALPMSSTTFWMVNLRFHKKWLFVPFLLTGSDFNVPIAALSGALRRSSSQWCSWWEWEWRGWCWDWSGCWKGEDVEGPHSFTQQCPHGAKIYGWWFQWVKADGCDGNPNQFYAGKVGKPYGALPLKFVRAAPNSWTSGTEDGSSSRHPHVPDSNSNKGWRNQTSHTAAEGSHEVSGLFFIIDLSLLLYPV